MSSTTFEYGEAGLLEVMKEGDLVTVFHRDADGRLLRAERPPADESLYSYPSAGTIIEDAGFVWIRYRTDERNFVQTGWVKRGGEPSHFLDYEYSDCQLVFRDAKAVADDLADDKSRQRTYDYDAQGNLVSTTSGAGHQLAQYTYECWGG